jgi:hypothetical protein
VELRLQIYSYLIPLDIEYHDLQGLIMSCRTIKEEVYDSMRSCVQKSRNRLQARWPFDKPFKIPFPGFAFKTKQLLVEVPYYSSGQVFNMHAEMMRKENIMLENFMQEGAFDLGARSVVLRITALDAVQTTAPIPFYRLPPPRPGERAEKEAPLLLKLYLRLCLSGSLHKKVPEQMSFVLLGRDYPGCPHTIVLRVVELVRGSEDKFYLTESLREPANAGTWPLITT